MEKKRAPEGERRGSRKRTGQERTRDERMGEGIRLFQMGLWVSLILIQMLVVENMKVYAFWQRAESEEGLMVLCSEQYSRPEDCPRPRESYQTETGEEYVLVSWEKERVVVPEQNIPVVREGVYEQAEGITQLPESINVEAERQGQQTEVTCLLEEKTVVREEWKEGFAFPVIFHKYDADSYWLGDHLVEGGGEEPGLEGCEDLLLEEIGVPPEFYRIMDIRWDGDPYEDRTGELCRNALASGQKLLRDYRLSYRGTAHFPAYEAWQIVAVYEPTLLPGSLEEDQEEDAVREPVFVQSEESLPAVSDLESSPTLWERITRILLITIALGAMFFFGGLLFLALLWGKRAWMPYGRREQKEKEKTRRKTREG